MRIYRNQVGTSNTSTPVGSTGAKASPKEIFQQQGNNTEDFLAYQSLLLQQQALQHRGRTHKPMSSNNISSKGIESGCTSHDSDASNGSNDQELTNRLSGSNNERFHNSTSTNKNQGNKKRSSADL